MNLMKEQGPVVFRIITDSQKEISVDIWMPKLPHYQFMFAGGAQQQTFDKHDQELFWPRHSQSFPHFCEHCP
jgi:hypothetical protein